MKPLAHLFWSIIPVIFLWQLFGPKALIFFVGSVLIDIDHYFVYIYKFKDWNLSRCYNSYISNNFLDVDNYTLIFHNAPFFFIMAILSLFNIFILLLTIGLCIHYVLDSYIKIHIRKWKT